MLQEGACMQLGVGQFNCGLELALLLAEVPPLMIPKPFMVDPS